MENDTHPSKNISKHLILKIANKIQAPYRYKFDYLNGAFSNETNSRSTNTTCRQGNDGSCHARLGKVCRSKAIVLEWFSWAGVNLRYKMNAWP